MSIPHHRRVSTPSLRPNHAWDRITEQVKQSIIDQKALNRPQASEPLIGLYHKTPTELKPLRDRAILLIVRECVLRESYSKVYDEKLARMHRAATADLDDFMASKRVIELDHKAAFLKTVTAGAHHVLQLPAFRTAVATKGLSAVKRSLVQPHVEDLVQDDGV